MKPNKLTKNPNDEETDTIWVELVMGLFGLIMGSSVGKVTGFLLLTIIGITSLASAISGSIDKPMPFYFIGTILILAGTVLVMRINEIKRDNLKKRNSSKKTN